MKRKTTKTAKSKTTINGLKEDPKVFKPNAISVAYRCVSVVSRQLSPGINITETIFENIMTGELMTVRGDNTRKLGSISVFIERLE
jgi:hypothetical protein